MRNTETLERRLNTYDEEKSNDYSLYARIGGGRVIAEVVDVFYDRILADPEMRPFFTSIIIDAEAIHLNKGRFERFLCAAMGGPVIFNGRGMKESHQNMHIQSHIFDKFIDYFTAALREREINSDLLEEMRKLLNSFRPDIVVQSHQEDASLNA